MCVYYVYMYIYIYIYMHTHINICIYDVYILYYYLARPRRTGAWWAGAGWWSPSASGSPGQVV